MNLFKKLKNVFFFKKTGYFSLIKLKNFNFDKFSIFYKKFNSFYI